MTKRDKKVIKFPANVEKSLDEINKKYEARMNQYRSQIEKANWFGCGLLTGILVATIIFSTCFYFIGVKI